MVEDVVIKPDGKQDTYSYAETPDQSVFIVALTDKNKVYLVGQYRYPGGHYSWELPGGGCDGDEVLIAAGRELLEETGLTAKKWQIAGHFVAMNGVCAELTNVLIAQDLAQTDKSKIDKEITEVKKVKFDEVLKMIEENKITDGQSIAALMKARLFLGKKS